MPSPDAPASTASRRLTTTWIVAGLLTVASWATALAVDDGDRTKASKTVAVVGLALGTVKVRLIIQQFMDVRVAPRWLRLFTDLWLATLSVAVLVMYLAA